MKTKKFYCYVDETGQDTQGELFIVSVVIVGTERDQALELCERIERQTGKGRRKWIRARYAQRLAYIQQILREPIFQDKLVFSIYINTRDYLSVTIQTIALAIQTHVSQPEKVTVLLDGLPRSQQRTVGARLRRLGIRMRKVRGVRKDESNALIRLADALSGFVRAAVEGQEEMEELLQQGKQRGYLRELGEEKNPRG